MVELEKNGHRRRSQGVENESLAELIMPSDRAAQTRAEGGKGSVEEETEQDPHLKEELIPVIHVPQAHFVSGYTDKDPERFEEVARCQHKIACFLLKHPNAIVISEGLTEDLTLDYRKKMPEGSEFMAEQCRMAMPQGLPAEYEQLSELQRDLLAVFGAAEVLFYMGERKSVSRALPPEDAQRIDEEIGEFKEKYGDAFYAMIERNPRLYELVHTIRENLILKEFERITRRSSYQGEQIIIVYGAKHSFPDEFSDTSKYKFERKKGFDDDPERLKNLGKKRFVKWPEIGTDSAGPGEGWDGDGG